MAIGRVVAVGGDGIYNEVVSGLTVRELRDHGQDPDNPESKLLQLKISIGIIQAGSGKYTAWYRNSTECPVTAALWIVMGHCVSTNIASLHQGNKCSGYSGLIFGFGLFGDVMRDCEKYRWMGTSRFIEDRVLYTVDTYPITMKPDGTKMVPNFGGDSLELQNFLKNACF